MFDHEIALINYSMYKPKIKWLPRYSSYTNGGIISTLLMLVPTYVACIKI